MNPKYLIHPAVGVARLGNSELFYLAPDKIGGLPITCDEYGNVTSDNPTIRRFKHDGKVIRQAATFSVYRHDDPYSEPTLITLDTKGVKSIKWTVRMANKKSAWYQFDFQVGNSLNPDAKPYTPDRIRNKDTKNRSALIIDSGLKTISGSCKRAKLSITPNSMKLPPSNPTFGSSIESLGEIRTDSRGCLVYIAGYGRAGGNVTLSPAGDTDGWFDDVADGPVVCELILKDHITPIVLDAWCLAVPPKYAPELVNVVTLDDVMFDVAARHFLVPRGFTAPTYVVSLHEVRSMMSRIERYAWVANIPSAISFGRPPFDVSDNSVKNRPNRKRYVSHFRSPAEANVLSVTGTVPSMPLLAGANPDTNDLIFKFLTLTATQYHVLRQWAAGFFKPTRQRQPAYVSSIDRVAVANCVGAPFCPGYEVSWTLANPKIYSGPWRIKHRDPMNYTLGLSPDRDETLDDPRTGEPPSCEPGDLTKRMQVPWQSDVFGCNAQPINFSKPKKNMDAAGAGIPPTYLAYWWAAQSPVSVIAGGTTAGEQSASGLPAGTQVSFARGINSIGDLVLGWSYLGFVLNQNTGKDSDEYPYFTEVERNHDRFHAGAVAVGHAFNFVLVDDVTFVPMFFLKERLKAK